MTAKAGVICWQVATALLSVAAGLAIASGRPWWGIVIPVAAALVALAAGIEATNRLARTNH
jgi:hypothetical protein